MAPPSLSSPECLMAQAEVLRLQKLLHAHHSDIHEIHAHPLPDSAEFWWLVLLAFLFLCLAGLASGLTVGLLGMDRTSLRLKCSGPDPTERRQAKMVLKVIEDHHRLLITLLLANTFANECLPIVLDRLVPAYLAVMLSIFGVLVFGEILPMSFLTGPRQLELAARMSGIVEFMMWLLACVGVPVARLLDHLVGSGHHLRTLNRRELQSLIQINAEGPCQGRGGRRSKTGSAPVDEFSDSDEAARRRGSGVSSEDVRLAVSALDFSTKCASSCMRGLNEVFMLDAASRLDAGLLRRVREEGYSRVPIFSGRRDHIVGVLLAKALVGLEPQQGVSLEALISSSSSTSSPACGSGSSPIAQSPELPAAVPKPAKSPWLQPPVVPPELTLPELVTLFRTHSAGCQMALVAEGGKVLGIVTIKDALEELLQGQLEDEFDRIRRSGLASPEPCSDWFVRSRLSPVAAEESCPGALSGRRSNKDPPVGREPARSAAALPTGAILGKASADDGAHEEDALMGAGGGSDGGDGSDDDEEVASMPPLHVHSKRRRPRQGDLTPSGT